MLYFLLSANTSFTDFLINLLYNSKMLNLNSIMVGSAQPKVLADFYTKVLDKPADMNEGGWWGWLVGSTFFSVGEHSEVRGSAKEPQRIILNFEAQDIEDEFERIKSIGAEVVKELYEMPEMPGMKIATFADPDGNYFQLMTPWEEGK